MHRKLISFLFIASFSFSQDVNWERINSCPVGDPEFVKEVLEGMTVEEKVGQTIMADLDFISPSDLKRFPIGGILNGGNTSPNGNQKASTDEWKGLAEDFHIESTLSLIHI